MKVKKTVRCLDIDGKNENEKIKEIIKKYLKENLRVDIGINYRRNFYGNSLVVELYLEGEMISSNSVDLKIELN